MTRYPRPIVTHLQKGGQVGSRTIFPTGCYFRINWEKNRISRSYSQKYRIYNVLLVFPIFTEVFGLKRGKVLKGLPGLSHAIT